MAKKIVWSKVARDDFRSTLRFYCDRNGNDEYSSKLAETINSAIEKISRHVLIGRPSDDKNVRVLSTGSLGYKAKSKRAEKLFKRLKQEK